MFKILTLIYLFVILYTNISYGDEGYKIIVKVNAEIISNYDIKKEKNYLIALNPKILNIPKDEITKLAKNSLIREIIKKEEVSKYYEVDYNSKEDLIPLKEKLYTTLNINTEEELRIYLTKYDLILEEVLEKIAIENSWNLLIYQKYKDKVNINKVKIKKNLELESSTTDKEKLFLLSEILFTANNQEEFEENYQKILNTIKAKDFKSAATIYSSSDTAKFGGEIGWMGKKDISKKIYKKISALKINEFTEPFKIAAGFLLINLDSVKEEDRNNLEETYNNIIIKETNKQLNQYSVIYYKKIEKQSFIYEG